MQLPSRILILSEFLIKLQCKKKFDLIDDSLDDEEVMIKQVSNDEGQEIKDGIEEENKDQILNDDQDFSFIQKLSSRVKEKALLHQKDIAEIIERNYKFGISEKQLLSKKIRGISPATVYRH